MVQKEVIVNATSAAMDNSGPFLCLLAGLGYFTGRLIEKNRKKNELVFQLTDNSLNPLIEMTQKHLLLFRVSINPIIMRIIC